VAIVGSQSGNASVTVSPAVTIDQLFPATTGDVRTYNGTQASPGNTQTGTRVQTVEAAADTTSVPGRTVIRMREDDTWTGPWNRTQWTYLQETADALLFVASREGANPIEVLPTPTTVFQAPLAVGETWQLLWGPGLMTDGPVAATGTIEALDETVTVPAGTFTGCARIQFTYGPFTSTEPQWSGFSCTGTETSWSAPGVGMVRDTTHEVGTKAGSPTQTYDKNIELVSYTVQ